MKLISKVVGVLTLTVMASVGLAAAVFHAVPDYLVEVSAVTGECKKVEYRGQIVPNGCSLVVAGKIARYEQVKGY